MLIFQLYPDLTGHISVDGSTFQLWRKLTQSSYLSKIFIQAFSTILHFPQIYHFIYGWFKLLIRPDNLRLIVHPAQHRAVGEIIQYFLISLTSKVWEYGGFLKFPLHLYC